MIACVTGACSTSKQGPVVELTDSSVAISNEHDGSAETNLTSGDGADTEGSSPNVTSIDAALTGSVDAAPAEVPEGGLSSSDLGQLDAGIATVDTAMNSIATIDAVDAATPGAGSEPFVTFTFESAVYLVPADGSREPENISERIERTGGADRWLVPSPRGTVFALSSARADDAAEILVRANTDFTVITPVLAGGSEVYVEGMPAIVDTGDVIVFSATGGTHERDLFVTRETNGSWSAPHELTTNSPAEYNNQPSLTRGQDAVLFNCGSAPDPETGNNRGCRVGLDGGTVELVASPDTLPDNRNDYVNFPREITGGVVFESAWPQGEGEPPESIWKTVDEVTSPAVSRTFDNSVSPCVLADDSLVILWLGRPGGDGSHELTRVYADGTYATLWQGVDVADIGIGCTSAL